MLKSVLREQQSPARNNMEVNNADCRRDAIDFNSSTCRNFERSRLPWTAINYA